MYFYLHPTLQRIFLELKYMEEGYNNKYIFGTIIRVFEPTIREAWEVFGIIKS